MQPLVVLSLQVALDREWYDQEEGGAQIDETHNPFLGDQKLFQKKEAEMQQNEFQKDMNAWEENRMLTSGVVRMREVSPVVDMFCCLQPFRAGAVLQLVYSALDKSQRLQSHLCAPDCLMACANCMLCS